MEKTEVMVSALNRASVDQSSATTRSNSPVDISQLLSQGAGEANLLRLRDTNRGSPREGVCPRSPKKIEYELDLEHGVADPNKAIHYFQGVEVRKEFDSLGYAAVERAISISVPPQAPSCLLDQYQIAFFLQ
jgi:hypothetical protein